MERPALPITGSVISSSSSALTSLRTCSSLLWSALSEALFGALLDQGAQVVRSISFYPRIISPFFSHESYRHPLISPPSPPLSPALHPPHYLMYKNPALPTLHLSNGHGTSGPLPVVHCESDNEGSDSEAGILCGSVDPLSGTSYPRQDPLPPNTSVEPANWETTPAWVSVAINPSSQEALEGVGLSGAALSTYPPYSVGLTLSHDRLVPYTAP